MNRLEGWPGAVDPLRRLEMARLSADLPGLLRLYFRGWQDEAPTAEVVWSSEGSVTRAEFGASVTALLGLLLAEGWLSEPARVAIHLRDGLPNLVAGIALFLSGHCQVVLPGHAPAEEIRALLERHPCDWILTDRSDFAPEGWQAVTLWRPSLFGCLQPLFLLRAEPGRRSVPRSTPLGLEEGAFLMLSSGTTTGIPTVQLRSFFTCLHYATAAADWLYYTPRRLVSSNLQFASIRSQLLNLILAGCCLCWYRDDQEELLAQLYGSSGATRTHLLVPQLRRLAERQALPAFPSGLQILVGTDRVPLALRHAVHCQRPGCLAVTYSTSQSGPITFLPADHPPGDEESVGWPVPGVAVDLLEPPGADGGAEVRVDKVQTLAFPEADGGWNRLERRLVGFRPGDRLRRLPDGQFVFAGRSNDVFLLRGVLVSPLELETFLEAQSGVLEAVAFGAESEVYGAVPMAVVRLAEGLEPQPTARTLQRLSRRLFGFRGLYAVYANVEIPRGTGGKPLRRELARRYRLGG